MSQTVMRKTAYWPDTTNGWFKRFIHHKTEDFNKTTNTQRQYTALLNTIKQGTSSSERIGQVIYNNTVQFCLEIHHDRNKMVRFMIFYDRIGSHDLDTYNPIVDLLHNPLSICSYTKNEAQERFFVIHDEAIQLNCQTPDSFHISGVPIGDPITHYELPLYWKYDTWKPTIDEDNNWFATLGNLGFEAVPQESGSFGYVGNSTGTIDPAVEIETTVLAATSTLDLPNVDITQVEESALMLFPITETVNNIKSVLTDPEHNLQFEYDRPTESFMTHHEVNISRHQLSSHYNIMTELDPESRTLTRGAIYLYVLVIDNDDITVDPEDKSDNGDVAIEFSYCIQFEDK